MFRPIILITVLSLSFAAAQAAKAEGLKELTVFKETVKVADLDLNTQAGARRAIFRMAFAADRVCGEGSSNLTVSHAREQRECRERALAEAVDRTAIPMLSLAMIEQKGGSRTSIARR
jgi:UrcA family protein